MHRLYIIVLFNQHDFYGRPGLLIESACGLPKWINVRIYKFMLTEVQSLNYRVIAWQPRVKATCASRPTCRFKLLSFLALLAFNRNLPNLNALC